MDAMVSTRQARGAALAKSAGKAIRHIAGDTFFVPSATNAGAGYVVDASVGTCTCPDFVEYGAAIGRPCKHVFAIRYFRHEQAMPDGSTVVTEGIRVSYPQPDWAAYNRGQCEEGSTVRTLLRGLCDGIEQPTQHMGRPRAALKDLVYCATLKVFDGKSGRRSKYTLETAEKTGLVDHAARFNTISKYLGKPELAPLLTKLVEESARPLAAVERNFAADATGFNTSVYARWHDHKHGGEQRYQRWVKLHVNTGVLTHVITAAVVTEGRAHDSPVLPELVERTARNFDMREQSADKGYLSHDNLAAIEAVGAKPFIPFKSNSQSKGSEAWERLYHLFSLNNETFRHHYHRRSNVEAVFSSMKRKFGGGVLSKTQTAQFNEVLLKCLCHNLSMVTMAIHELGVEPKFWMPRAVDA